MTPAMSMAIALFLRPIAAIILAYILLVPIRKLVERKMKDGKLKRLLLKRVGRSDNP